jgi:peptidoglycan/xylan/chitin deacetylase (PgdA/CDA1 family)
LGAVGLIGATLVGAQPPQIRFLGATRYLNNMGAVVTHTIDDSTDAVPACLDAIDHYGIKATIFINTASEVVSRLWPRLRQAVTDGHEIGSHSRRHQCLWPATRAFCSDAYSADEIEGSRHDILTNTPQPHVWSWSYPCGNCATEAFVQRRLARAGYVVARSYPDEPTGGHLVPNLQTWARNPFNAAYTQVAQRQGGIAADGRTDIAALNRKFDEVLANGGIYSVMSHPQWVDFGPAGFYEQHLAYIGRRRDVWYVPMGPLYAFHAEVERIRVRQIDPHRFEVSTGLDPSIYHTSITLMFAAPGSVEVLAHGTRLSDASRLTDRWDDEYVRREEHRVFVTVRPSSVVEFR